MRKVNYKEKGITLVALVVTIIILLILAGVTLSTALSQNGLFQRAKIAGENYKKAESDEAERLDEYSSEIDKIINGETPSTTEKLTIPKKEGDEPDDSQLVDLGDVTVNGQELKYKWYYYYTDENNVYLIYEDYLEENAIPTGINITKSGINVYASGNREKLINYLNTESNWNNIKTGIENALKEKEITTTVSVKGTPTADQLAKAYNERYGKDSLTIENDDNGVKYKLNSSSAATNVSVSSLDVYINQNKVFFPHKQVSNSCKGYWLASLGANGSDRVCDVESSGSFYLNIYSNSNYGVRPVVSIPKSAIQN